MQKSEKTIVSTVSLLASLVSYWYARTAHKDAVPYVMIGGFLGSLVGDMIAKKIDSNES